MKRISWLSLPLATVGCLIPWSTQAQVTPDGTTSTTVNGDGNNFTIEQGDRVGDNLFHSFSEFSVPTLGSAVFNNAGDIANIFSRVTGSSISNIDGTLSANGAANLFLINPNGIIFGENARLNLGGSFFASTADSLLFEGDTEFSAVNPEAPPLLEVNIPIGASFRDSPGDITIEKQPPGSADFDPAPSFDDNLFGLRVPNGKSFALAGGNITLDGGGVVSVGGQIELGSVAQAGTLEIDLSNDNINLVFPENLQRANVSLTNGSGFLVSGSGGGNLTITANNINISEASSLNAGIFSGLGEPNAQAGDIVLNATDNIVLDNSFVLNQVSENALGSGGNLFIDTSNISIVNGGQAGVLTFGTGDTGELTINANESIQLNSGNTGSLTGIFAQVLQNGVGDAGNTSIETKNLSIINNARIGTNTFGRGNAGDLNLKTEDLIISDGAQITGSTLGQGNGGNLSIIANDIRIDGGENGFFTALTSSVGEQATGTGGNITIGSNEFPVEQLTVINGGQILTSVFGQGDGGDITIDASNSIQLDGGNNGFATGILAQVREMGNGNSGNLTIETPQLNLNNGAQIRISTFGQGDTGDLSINASESISIDGFGDFPSGIFSNIDQSANGNTGNITIETERFDISDGAGIDTSVLGIGNSGNVAIETGRFSVSSGAVIDTSVLGIGNSGNLTINASESINISGADNNFGGLSAQLAETGSGNGGNITLNTQVFNLNNNGQISASIFGEGQTGDITINASESINISENSSLFSEVGQNATGNTGNIFLETELLDIDSSSITTTTFSGVDAANVEINSQNLIIENGSLITTQTSGSGNGGDLTIFTETLEVKNGSGLSSDTSSSGNGGTLTITTENLLVEEGLIANGTTTGEGMGGTINVNASESIELIGTFGEGTPGGLNVQTQSSGDAGDLNVNTKHLMIRDGASIGASTRFGSGNGGNLTINTEDLFVENAQISASTFSDGNAGDLTINAFESVELIGTNQGLGEDPSGIFAQTNPESSGNGGNLTIETNRLIARNGGQVSATSLGTGNAGNLTINAAELVGLSGTSLNGEVSSGIFAATELTGDAGELRITTEKLTVNNEARISANSEGEGSGGNLFIEANSLTLSDRASMLASTESGEGGNATIELDDSLILRNNSNISARAVNDANGGNLNINTDFIIAFPGDSNITADAVEGQGGNISISAESLFGIEERLLSPFTNDINASSEFGLEGDIAINTPEVDPTTGLINLPTSVGDASDQISQNPCQQGVGSEFIVTGKGGLPPSVNESVNSESARVGLIEPIEARRSNEEARRYYPAKTGLGVLKDISIPLDGTPSDKGETGRQEEYSDLANIPAQGWVFNDRGEVTLTAHTTSDNKIKRPNVKHFDSCSSKF